MISNDLIYRSLMEQLADGIVISDVYGKIVSVNAAALKLLGQDDESKLIGTPVSTIIDIQKDPNTTIEPVTGRPDLFRIKYIHPEKMEPQKHYHLKEKLNRFRKGWRLVETDDGKKLMTEGSGEGYINRLLETYAMENWSERNVLKKGLFDGEPGSRSGNIIDNEHMDLGTKLEKGLLDPLASRRILEIFGDRTLAAIESSDAVKRAQKQQETLAAENAQSYTKVLYADINQQTTFMIKDLLGMQNLPGLRTDFGKK